VKPCAFETPVAAGYPQLARRSGTVRWIDFRALRPGPPGITGVQPVSGKNLSTVPAARPTLAATADERRRRRKWTGKR